MDTLALLKINEIFYSLQGESKHSGKPTTFIRLSGCPFRCSYCDTEYAFREGVKKTIPDIIQEISKYKTKLITVTGGEPLSQKNVYYLFDTLVENNYKVSIETSGLVDIKDIPNEIEIVMDIKTPSSRESHNNLYTNLDYLSKNDTIKFVISSKEDYQWAKRIIKKYSLTKLCPVYFSPSYNDISIKNIANWVLKDSLPVTIQCQLHKHIWGEIRGV
ncbi:MAG: 7-carboxy-7-deazaguanine synthase QueE [Gammaproteobacteria bacterium]|nr:7-carboxy-7-deazaguanine synthase QueE [Gammaproteobacteria bacterium]|tara:strand:- start:526 stop:1176 length:651 start_codon:yes stop_codon:yes gene_type:complete